MKREPADFWSEYREQYVFYFCVTLIAITVGIVFIIWTVLPLILALWFTPWFTLLYLLTIPAMVTSIAALGARGIGF